MSTTQDIEPFRGGGWDECSAFIQRIRAAAWKEGKLRDPGWIADFASLHLAGQALAWYFRLPPDIQEDWTKLQAALTEKWPFLGNDPSRQPNVSAAAAPSRERREKLGCMERGILKAIIAGKEATHYVQLRPNDNLCRVTTDPGKALRVRFDSQSNSQLFECVTFSQHVGVPETSLAGFRARSGRVDLAPDREVFYQEVLDETPLQFFIQKVD
ncbi:hypothetical protein FRC01_001838 [Tulasnella sp. 417]|nr:hypothetical protein FRC01_001838 [Tulasnella sp. 417]